MDDEHVCDDCGDTFPLPQVMISGERTVCGDCVTVEDRIID